MSLLPRANRVFIFSILIGLTACATPLRTVDRKGTERCVLSGRDTLDEVITKVRICMTLSRTGWLQGFGWTPTLFESVPFRDNPLDNVETTGPIALLSTGHDAYWVNHVALEIAGITAVTRDPANGRIGRIPGTFRPNGLLFGSAMNLVGRFIPKPERGMARISP